MVYRTDTNARGFWFREKKRHAREFSRNQSILRFDVILQHDWPIERCLFHIRVFSGGKTKRPCFDLFIHWLIKPKTNTYKTIFQGHMLVLFKYVQVDSLIELKEHDDLSLAEEAQRNWIEVLDQTYLFDRRRREVGAVLTHIELPKTTQNVRLVLSSK